MTRRLRSYLDFMHIWPMTDDEVLESWALVTKEYSASSEEYDQEDHRRRDEAGYLHEEDVRGLMLIGELVGVEAVLMSTYASEARARGIADRPNHS